MLLTAAAQADPSPQPALTEPSPQPIAPQPVVIAPSPQPVVSAPAPANPQPAKPAHLRGRTKRIAGVVTTLVGAAFVVGAAALGNQAVTDSDTVSILFAQGGVWNQQAAAIEKEAKQDQLTLEVLYPIGGALMIAGITTAIIGWYEDTHPKEKAPKVSISPIQKGAAATWSVSF